MSEHHSSMQPIRRIVIVGGGTAGWLAAAMLACHFRRDVCAVELVEAADIGIVGVGESTLPPFVQLLHKLGIDQSEFVRETNGCYKLGIRFVDWLERPHSYFHPFGSIGQRLGGHDFYQCWLKANRSGADTGQRIPPLMAFSPCAAMAEAGRFYRPGPAGPMGSSYALHMDAALAVQYLRRYALARGVTHTRGRVTDLQRSGNGHIETIHLDHGAQVNGDFFIDCTGFNALLIGRHLGVPLEDWSAWLPCDSSISVKTQAGASIAPYTQATARKSGWSWRIPLRDSTGHGYVYASRFCSDAEAKSTLMKHLDAPRISDPKVIPFTPGRRREAWKHNCLSLGLAAGFVEPLESTSIHLIARGMEFFFRYFPDRHCEPALIREYNRRMAMDFEEIRDFILLHYCTTRRTDTPFWRWCRQLSLPDTLRERLELFRSHGTLRDGVDELFRGTSWQAVFEGMGIRPDKYCPRVDNLDFAHIADNLAQHRAAIKATVTTLPHHEATLPG